ncbi:enoyl-CoA hydratase/isomerase family protein [Alcaligenaceae bacterium]|nr:enoyl-CoA hydratase/isomerase family protein [Alcaligenaceae bacterium]
MKSISYRASSFEMTGDVGVFTHRDPSSRNSLSEALRGDYREMLDLVDGNRSIRALVITGSGGSFSSGGDVKGMSARTSCKDNYERSPDYMRRHISRQHYIWLDRLRSIEVPVIAAVDGPAYGAGFSLALSADFILASTRATFCGSFARVGAIPDLGALYLLPRIVGLTRAKEICMTARRVEAEEAARLGIVLETHAPESLLDRAIHLGKRLAQGPIEAMGMMKNSLNRSFELDYRSMGELESAQQAVALASQFHIEASARFSRKDAALYDWERGSE